MFVFGSGVLIGTPSGTNPTPINFGLVQEVSLDISVNLKPLYGQYNFPVAVGAGTKKMSGKAKLARISAKALGSLFFGVTPSVGQTVSQYGETATVPSTPFTVTVANGATFAADLGVVYAATGLPLTRVATPSAVGQYSVNTPTGAYTFYSSDATTAVLISYTYTVSASGSSFTAAQALLGPTTVFSANLFAADPVTGKQFSVNILQAVAQKLSFGTKLEDFLIPDFEFECFANAAGNALQFNFGDAA